MTSLATVLSVAAVLWPIALGAALVDRSDGPPSAMSSLVYVAASRVCHQRPDRSFHTHGTSWPVCARCAGLYVAAPLGIACAGPLRRRGRALMLRGVALAATPMAATWVLEAVLGVPVSAGLRFVTAAPLGIMVAGALVALAQNPPSNRID